MFAILSLFFTLSFAQSRCSIGNRKWIYNCSTLTGPYDCVKYYRWAVNTVTTAYYFDQPMQCVWDFGSSTCKPSGTECSPECRLDPSTPVNTPLNKDGGPNGGHVTIFTTTNTVLIITLMIMAIDGVFTAIPSVALEFCVIIDLFIA